MLVLYLPLAYLGAALAGVPGLFTGVAVANVIAGMVAYVWFQRVIKDYSER